MLIFSQVYLKIFHKMRQIKKVLQTEVVHAIFYIHQTSGACTGMCMCNCMHQIEKIVLGILL